jgi:hypothetical protein
MSRTVKTRHRTSAGPILLVGLTLVAIVVTALAFATGTTPQQATQPTPVPHFVDTTQQDQQAAASVRTIVIARPGETLPHMSGAEGPLMTTLVRGQLPDGVTKAIARTDENCAPDEEGVSHCLNELDVGTATVTVQHHHKMSLTPCLTPGEEINIMTAAQYLATL